MNSSEAMNYADTYIFGASDFVDPFWKVSQEEIEVQKE